MLTAENQAKETQLPLLKSQKGIISLKKSNQRHRIYLNQDIELVKSLSFDRRVNDLLEHKRTIKMTLENIDQNEEVLTERLKGKRKSKDQTNTNPNSNALTHSSSKSDVTFKIKEDSLQHIMKMESEKQFEVDLALKTNQLSLLQDESESLNNKIANCQSEINEISYEIELLNNYAKFALILSSTNGDNEDSVKIKKEKQPSAFERMNLLAKGHHKRIAKKEGLEKNKNEIIKEMSLEKEKYSQTKAKISTVKKDIKALKNRMKDYYHVLLYKGIDYRQEGLIYYIKAIWNLGFNVDVTFLPSFLDKEAIDYLFIIAKKSIEINALRQKITETKMKYSKELRNHFNNFQFETRMIDCKSNQPMNKKKSQYVNTNQSNREEKLTVRQINAHIANKTPLDKSILIVFAAMNKLSYRLNQLELEMINLREKEVKRITKEFIINDYENKYNVSIEALIGALVGETYKDKELNHFSQIRNAFMDNIKKASLY